jgi:hypothetical protein
METRQVEPTGWVGWIAFAGVMLIIVGALQALYGLVAIFNDQWVVWNNGNSVWLDITAWGWVHLIAGIVLVLAGLGVFTGNVLARAVGVVVAALSAILAFLGLPLYPIWSLIVITLDVLVIWALIAHGGEVRRV